MSEQRGDSEPKDSEEGFKGADLAAELTEGADVEAQADSELTYGPYGGSTLEDTFGAMWLLAREQGKVVKTTFNEAQFTVDPDKGKNENWEPFFAWKRAQNEAALESYRNR